MYDMVVSSRDSLNGHDLTSIVVPADEIPTDIGWVEFDFPDIDLSKGRQYYIVTRTTGDSSHQGLYFWGCGHRTPYVNGSLLYSFNAGHSWKEVSFLDFCFKTYGIESGQ